MDTFDFDEGQEVPALKQILIKFRGKKYLLIEALADTVAEWRNAQMAGIKMQAQDNNDTKIISLGKMADAEMVLVGGCLFIPDDSGAPQLDSNSNLDLRYRVGVARIRHWPQRVIAPLFDAAMEISGLKEKDTLESLDRQIEALQRRRAKLVASQETNEEDALAKNSLARGEVGLDSLTS